MKKYILLIVFCAALCAACENRSREMETETLHLADSSANLHMRLNVELPLSQSAAAEAIRNSLLTLLDQQLSHLSYEDNGREFPPFSGDSRQSDLLLHYLLKEAFQRADSTAAEDVSMHRAFILENAEMTEEQKQEALSYIPLWEYEFSISRIGEGAHWIVFQSQNYQYTGGAHGGVWGAGCLTFDKRTGKRISPMIDPAQTQAIQPLLVKGLQSYYAECDAPMSAQELLDHLFIENGVIPLPGWAPYPNGEGLVFVYQQYEIASYAEGMPAFTLALDEVRPFLTPEAAKLFE